MSHQLSPHSRERMVIGVSGRSTGRSLIGYDGTASHVQPPRRSASWPDPKTSKRATMPDVWSYAMGLLPATPSSGSP
jgi:hypothetical protein